MVSTRSALEQIAGNIDESMGVRPVDAKPRLSPVASARDVGRTPLRHYGRLRLDRIVADPDQPRTEFDESEIQRLASSLRTTGQIQPVGVSWNDKVGKWVIITGERRFRAAGAAGLDAIDCYFEEGELSKAKRLEKQLVENLLRQDLNPLEEARGYRLLIELNGWNGKQVAEAVSVSTSKVSRALALLELPEDVQRQVESGDIPRTSAYELTKLSNTKTQRDLADRVAADGLTQQQATRKVRQRRGKKAPRTRGIRQVFKSDGGLTVTVTANRMGNYYEIEEALQHALDEVRHRINNNVQLF